MESRSACFQHSTKILILYLYIYAEIEIFTNRNDLLIWEHQWAEKGDLARYRLKISLRVASFYSSIFSLTTRRSRSIRNPNVQSIIEPTPLSSQHLNYISVFKKKRRSTLSSPILSSTAGWIDRYSIGTRITYCFDFTMSDLFIL